MFINGISNVKKVPGFLQYECAIYNSKIQIIQSRVVYLYVAGKGCRVISESLDIMQSTVRQIFYKWRQLLASYSGAQLTSLQGHNAECSMR